MPVMVTGAVVVGGGLADVAAFEVAAATVVGVEVPPGGAMAVGIPATNLLQPTISAADATSTAMVRQRAAPRIVTCRACHDVEPAASETVGRLRLSIATGRSAQPIEFDNSGASGDLRIRDCPARVAIWTVCRATRHVRCHLSVRRFAVAAKKISTTRVRRAAYLDVDSVPTLATEDDEASNVAVGSCGHDGGPPIVTSHGMGASTPPLDPVSVTACHTRGA